MNIQATFRSFLFPKGILLQIDGAGRRHGAPVLGYDGQVTRPVAVWDKIIWFVVVVWMCGVVCNFTPDVVGEEIRGHVPDELRRTKWEMI